MGYQLLLSWPEVVFPRLMSQIDLEEPLDAPNFVGVVRALLILLEPLSLDMQIGTLLVVPPIVLS